MKVYPLQVKELREFEGGPLGWWSKGHHEAGVFLAGVAELEREPLDASRVRLEWWRCVPTEGGSLLCRAKEGSRGAFPVTVVE
jgi:hypothetical protein